MSGSKPDPPVRPDGRCARPGCGKRLVTTPPKTMPRSLREPFLKQLAGEPFCSSACCRVVHECSLPKAGSSGDHMSEEAA